MNEDVQKRAKRILDAIGDLPEAERAAALERECRGDEALRAEVRSLLDFWSAPTIDWVESDAAGTQPTPSTRVIGPYRIIREIGRGGMGVVWLAKRKGDRFRRLVALKVLKRGMDGEDVLRRFEMERQVLAAMNHPGIARLYDAGETDDDTPYFVMEYVEGTDIATYCDTRRLHVAERLEIFRKVCEAVHYAHQNLVVHRDLKPSNIIVTEDGQPKLLDFGIAKIINPQFSLVTGDPTAPEFRVMTPEYASPEQVRGDTITTASDVYSLGVLLYQLVCGHPPYRIRTRVREELVRLICETEPERPSTAVGTVEALEAADGGGGTTTITPKSVGDARDSRPHHLRRALAGDIATMVMKALRKEPQRRYTSALQFAEDIRRHFDGLPVIARPDTLAYRASKFVKRNRAGVAAAAVIVLILVGGIIGVWSAKVDAVKARDAERVQRDRAEFNRDLVIGTLDSFGDASRSIAKLTNALPARKIIAETVLGHIERLSAQSGEDLTVQRQLASAHQLYGDLNGIRNPTYGDAGIAIGHYREALAIRRSLADQRPDDRGLLRETIVSHINLAGELRKEGEAEAALGIIEPALGLSQRLQEGHSDDLDARRVRAAVLITAGDCRVANGDVAAAIDDFEDSYNLRLALVNAYEQGTQEERDRADRDLAVICSRLGAHLPAIGRIDEARSYLMTNLTIRQKGAARVTRGDTRRERRDFATARALLADFEREQGHPDAARGGFEQAIVETEQLAAEDHDDVRPGQDLARYRYGAGQACLDMENWQAAVGHLRIRLDMDDPHDPWVLSLLALAYEKGGQSDLASTTIREALGLLDGRTGEAAGELRAELDRRLSGLRR